MEQSEIRESKQNYKAVLAALCICLSALPVFADVTVVPVEYTNLLANTSDNAPLGASDQHIQQIYAASLLSGLPVGSQITAIGFRIASGEAGIASQTVPDYSIWMGSAGVAPGSMSATFADNRSSDFNLVRSGALDISAGDFPGGSGVNDFGFIYFDTPYIYEGGDLLIEISYGHFSAGGADVNAAYPYDSTQAQTAFGSGSSSTLADQGLFNEAIIMSFIVTPPVTPVPEPTALALLVVGIAVVPLVRARSNRRG